MYAGHTNLSNTALLEQLLFIASETSAAASGLNRLLSGGALPSPEVIDKFLRQDLAMAKDRIDDAVEKILYYIASARMELIDYKEFFINIALRFRNIIDMVEATTHRILLLRRKINDGSDEEIIKGIAKLVKIGEEMLFTLTSSLRSLTSMGEESSGVVKIIETNVDKIKLREKTADEIYRSVFERLLDVFGNNMVAYILYREVLDSIEDTVDKALDQATDILILARSLVS